MSAARLLCWLLGSCGVLTFWAFHASWRPSVHAREAQTIFALLRDSPGSLAKEHKDQGFCRAQSKHIQQHPTHTHKQKQHTTAHIQNIQALPTHANNIRHIHHIQSTYPRAMPASPSAGSFGQLLTEIRLTVPKTSGTSPCRICMMNGTYPWGTQQHCIERPASVRAKDNQLAGSIERAQALDWIAAHRVSLGGMVYDVAQNLQQSHVASLLLLQVNSPL